VTDFAAGKVVEADLEGRDRRRAGPGVVDSKSGRQSRPFDQDRTPIEGGRAVETTSIVDRDQQRLSRPVDDHQLDPVVAIGRRAGGEGGKKDRQAAPLHGACLSFSVAATKAAVIPGSSAE
jgi:hypothetical protein